MGRVLCDGMSSGQISFPAAVRTRDDIQAAQWHDELTQRAIVRDGKRVDHASLRGGGSKQLDRIYIQRPANASRALQLFHRGKPRVQEMVQAGTVRALDQKLRVVAARAF